MICNFCHEEYFDPDAEDHDRCPACAKDHLETVEHLIHEYLKEKVSMLREMTLLARTIESKWNESEGVNGPLAHDEEGVTDIAVLYLAAPLRRVLSMIDKYQLDIDQPELSNDQHYELTQSNALLVITCPQHGPFIESAGRHLDGNGCPACDGAKYVAVNVCEAIGKTMEIGTTRRAIMEK